MVLSNWPAVVYQKLINFKLNSKLLFVDWGHLSQSCTRDSRIRTPEFDLREYLILR